MNILNFLFALPEKVSAFFRHPIIKGVEMFSNLCTAINTLRRHHSSLGYVSI